MTAVRASLEQCEQIQVVHCTWWLMMDRTQKILEAFRCRELLYQTLLALLETDK